MKTLATLFALLCAVVAGGVLWSAAQAQDNAAEEKGRFTRFVEDTISTPDRQISIGNIDGVLSSDVRIDRITIADREGVWLTIENAHLVWSRLALLTGTLDIDLLEADRIVASRPPLPSETVDPAAGGGFEVPELPVEVMIDRLAVPEVSLAAGLVGDEAVRFSVEGELQLADGGLDTDLAIVRTDDRPGRLALDARFQNESRQLSLDFRLEEEEDGVVANLLDIPGKPAIAFTVAGEGPLTDFGADISLSAAGEQLVAGRSTVSDVPEGLRFATAVDGNLGPLVPADYQAYVRGRSSLRLDLLSRDDGRFSIETAELSSGVLSLTATATFAADGFPTAIAVEGRLADPAAPVPVPGGTVEDARFAVDFGGTGERWNATFDLSGLDTGSLGAGAARIVANGVAENLSSPGERRLTFDVDGDLSRLTAADPALAEALGDAFEILARGRWVSGEPVEVEIAEIKNPNAAAHFRGTIDGARLDGRYTLNAADIAPFAGLVGQEIGGAVTLAAEGTVGAATGSFALTIDASTDDLRIGNPQIDPLLAGRTTLVGGASRTEDGLRFQDLRVENPGLSARLDGLYDLDRADLSVSATLADLSALTEQASGAVSFNARVLGPGTARAVEATVAAPSLLLDGRRLTDGLLRFDGRIDGSAVSGDVTLSGILDGVTLDGRATVATEDDGTRRVRDLRLAAGANTLEGDAALRPDGLIEADLRLDAPNVAVVAPLALVDAAGAVQADVRLVPEDARQAAAVTATAANLRIEENRIGRATVDLALDDLFGVPLAEGRFSAADVAAGGLAIDSVEGRAVREGETTRFDLAADLEAGRVETTGSLSRADGGFDLALQTLRLTREPDLTARLEAPATLSIRGDAIRIPEALLTVGGGRIRVAGTVAETVDLSASIVDLPLAIGNAFVPDLGLGGTVSGELTASGPRSQPEAAFDLAIRGSTAAALRDAGIPSVDASAEGRYADGRVTVTATTSIAGGDIRLSGTAGETLDLDVRISGLPLSIANAFSPGLAASGTLGATLDVSGTPSQPVVAFDVTGSGLNAAPLREVGAGPLALTASGRFEAMTVQLASATASGPSGLSIRASGRVPVSGGGVDLSVTGEAPLDLANASLATRGARLAGSARLDARVTGSLQDPRIDGSVAVDGATFTDPETTTQLRDVSLRVALTGDRATVERFSAAVRGGGTIAASGTIGLDPASGNPVDLTLRFDDARLTDGDIVTATASGAFAVRGSAAGTLAVTGTVDVARAEITIPESLPSSATLLDVQHRRPPPNVQRTLERARLVTGTGGGGGGGGASAGGLVLDVTINAPARVFVRGRGIDAELGGSVTIRGPASDIRPVGSLELIRGRIDVIGQRITFDSGRVTLVGDLDPYIDFVANARANGILVTATVTGTASSPEIILSSSPDLPQDEILAQFLFGRSITDLSPLQIARLAAAAAQLAGGGGTDLVGKLREATGLDDLDVVTDSEGNAAVQAGRYVSENVYLGVTAGSAGQSNVTVNLDITENLKARAEVGPSSGSKVGVFYEREY